MTYCAHTHTHTHTQDCGLHIHMHIHTHTQQSQSCLCVFYIHLPTYSPLCAREWVSSSADFRENVYPEYLLLPSPTNNTQLQNKQLRFRSAVSSLYNTVATYGHTRNMTSLYYSQLFWAQLIPLYILPKYSGAYLTANSSLRSPCYS